MQFCLKPVLNLMMKSPAENPDLERFSIYGMRQSWVEAECCGGNVVTFQLIDFNKSRVASFWISKNLDFNNQALMFTQSYT